MAQVPRNMPQVEVTVDQFCVGQFDGLQQVNEIMLVSDVNVWSIYMCIYEPLCFGFFFAHVINKIGENVKK